MHFSQLQNVPILRPSGGAPGKSSFWSPRQPHKTINFEIDEKCSCGNCRSNIFRRFRNFALFKPSWGPPYKGFFASCILYKLQIFSIWGPSGGALLWMSKIPLARPHEPTDERADGLRFRSLARPHEPTDERADGPLVHSLAGPHEPTDERADRALVRSLARPHEPTDERADRPLVRSLARPSRADRRASGPSACPLARSSSRADRRANGRFGLVPPGAPPNEKL